MTAAAGIRRPLLRNSSESVCCRQRYDWGEKKKGLLFIVLE